MRSTTGGEVGGGTSTDTSILEAEVRNTVVQGSNVQKDVHDLTIRALRKHPRDHESLRHVISAVVKGAGEGAEQKLKQTPLHAQIVLKSIRDAVAGLDAALPSLLKRRNWLWRKRRGGHKNSQMKSLNACAKTSKALRVCFWKYC